ncbi:hypothetical protein MNBD_GAMMA01-1313 [hydrothermal vent metagenome]|uniref:Uncharacterized protein n=1 Tax=hydrothermal vent metagenome TaxID=652676 RepID=A0A3B0V7K3_9ZZZZ
MKIKQITSQHRRDFTAIYECEYCEFKHPGSGYDDANFHQNVIPKMICLECGKSTEMIIDLWRPSTLKRRYLMKQGKYVETKGVECPKCNYTNRTSKEHYAECGNCKTTYENPVESVVSFHTT